MEAKGLNQEVCEKSVHNNGEGKMSEQMTKEYQKSLEFWDEWMKQTSEREVKNENGEDLLQEDFDAENAWKEVGSASLVEAATYLKEQKNVLDYGCGSGWASVIFTKIGCPYVKAVDVSKHGVEAAKKYAALFQVDNKIDFQAIEPNWLSKEQPEQFDGFFCSNVLDVVPKEVREEILAGAAKVCKKGAKLVIGLNPYFDKKFIEERNMVELEENHYAMDGILRIVNNTDEEWEQILGKYFHVLECRHFRWDGEPETVNRRIFILEK